MGWLVPQQDEFLRDLAELVRFIQGQGWLVTGGELYRTKEQQRIHFEAGRSRTLNSQHMKRLAVDLNIFKVRQDGVPQLCYEKEELEQFGVFWENLDSRNRWGGHWSFKDTAHFEKREWEE